MTPVDFIFLPVFFIIGLITSYEDMKYGKIRNKWTFFGFFWGVGWLLIFILWNVSAEKILSFLAQLFGTQLPLVKIEGAFIGESFLNIFISVIVAFFMWRISAWTAGDAKLFMAYSALIPISYYWKSYLPFFPAFALMINIFIIVLVYLIFKSLLFHLAFFYKRIRSGELKKETKEKAKKSVPLKEKLKKFSSSLYMLSGFLLIMIVFAFLGKRFQDSLPFDIFSLQAIIFAILILLSGYLVKFFRKPAVFKIILMSLVMVSVYGLFVDFYFALRVIVQSLVLITIFMTLFMTAQEIISTYIERKEKKQISVRDLQAGMNLNEGELDRLSLKREKGLQSGGLSKEHVRIIKKRAEQQEIEFVSIYKIFPFAFWMFLGALSILILKSSIVSLVIDFIKTLL